MAVKTRAKYTSKGGLGGKFTAGGKIERSPLDVMLNKFRSFKNGHKAYMTIQNPNPKETNKRFIRVEMKDLYGDYKKY